MPMKVTVCFGRVKVLVPCGDGDILVRELIEKAITRYKKAIGKTNDYWVSVHTLKTLSDGGILDPDDQLSDVVDDREQLQADFEEQGGHNLPGNGDGASASSAGTASPDIFRNELISNNKLYHQRGLSLDGGNDVVVTSEDISSGSGLTVRRGSEPALNVLEDKPSDNNHLTNGTSHDHWTNHDWQDNEDSNNNETKPVILGSNGLDNKNPFNRFARDSWRQSLGNKPNMYKWLEAQERQEERYKETERKEPLGGSTSPEDEVPLAKVRPRVLPPIPTHVPQNREAGVLICLQNDGTPLGIHVVPEFDDHGKEIGLLVQGIEPSGRIYRDGRLKKNDRIVEINGNELYQVPFDKAQGIFRAAMKTDEVRLKVVKYNIHAKVKKPPTVLPKPRGHTPVKPSPLTLTSLQVEVESPVSSPEKTSTPSDHNQENNLIPATEAVSELPQNDSNRNESHASENHSPQSQTSEHSTASVNQPIKSGASNQPVASTRKTPPAVPVRHPSTSLSNTATPAQTREVIIAPTNTKKLGKRIEINLVKGALGLGFSVTTRDNPAGGSSPIYIKNILPKGAAISDGQLKAGDRLLEVNGIEMTGKSQGEAVSILRNIKIGSSVIIVVSRQEVVDEKFQVPRELNDDHVDTDSFQPPEKSGDDGTLALMTNKEIIELNVPLNDSGSAGLGVSVKGKTLTTEEGTRDLGIFVKAVIHGGAASKDGRLIINDQLLEVNQQSLVNLPNTEAMERLRKAMQLEGPAEGCINLKIARKIGAASPSPFHGREVSMDLEYNKSDRTDGSMEYEELSPEGQDSKGNNSDNVPDMKDFKSPNLFLERINAGHGLRNVSYTRATHDSFLDSPDSSPLKPIRPDKLFKEEGESTQEESREDQKSGEIFEDQSSNRVVVRHGRTDSQSSSSEDDQEQPPWLNGPDWTRHSSQTTDEELSPVGDPAEIFNREGFGRQSMSEKRRGHVDPRSSEVYQRAKGMREGSGRGYRAFILQTSPKVPGPSPGRLVRVNSAESVISRTSSVVRARVRPVHEKYWFNVRTPPPTNLKRFSSLENLATTPDQDMSLEDDHNSSTDHGDDSSPQQRMTRTRGCNESFRAAVDRSYEPVPHLETVPMDPYSRSARLLKARDAAYSRVTSPDQLQVEEESSENGSFSQRHTSTNSARSSVTSEDTPDDPYSKKKGAGAKKGKEKSKSSGGILKGIFKFGRGRKTPDEHLTKGETTTGDEKKPEVVDPREQMARDAAVAAAARAEQERFQEYHRRLQEQQYYEQQRQQQQQQQHYDPQRQLHLQRQQQPWQNPNRPYPSRQEVEQPHTAGPPMTRAERIQQLRSEHQRKHQERHGQYPQDDKEEYYERQIQEEEARMRDKYGQSAIPVYEYTQGPRSRPQSRNQVERPNSRLGYPDYPSQSTSSYQDYNEINRYPYGNRHYSDSNMVNARPYSEVYLQRPPSRGPTPTNQWQYAEDPEMRREGQRRTEVPPNGGYYGNSNLAYRDPVYPAMAGRRTVQTISQPNSAKV